MTINKAIDIIKCLAWHTRPSEEDVEQAIKALEQQPCEDCISRDIAIANIQELAEWYTGDAFNADRVARCLKALPPVQPKYNTDEWCHDCSEYNQDKHCCPRYNRVIRNAVEEVKKPKAGHWIKITPSGIYMCSECEQNVLTGDIDAYHYCHHCGTRMIGLGLKAESEVEDGNDD
jgi:DNA-directed RNA polymerase subunit RPC12/RpoP